MWSSSPPNRGLPLRNRRTTASATSSIGKPKETTGIDTATIVGAFPDPAKAKAIRDLFAWGLGDGQHYASGLGYVPLPPEVVEKAQAALQTVKP